MTGGQGGGRETGLVRRVRRTAGVVLPARILPRRFARSLAATLAPPSVPTLVLAFAFSLGNAAPVFGLAASPAPAPGALSAGSTATAPRPALPKPSAYHAVEPAQPHAAPLPRPAAAPARKLPAVQHAGPSQRAAVTHSNVAQMPMTLDRVRTAPLHPTQGRPAPTAATRYHEPFYSAQHGWATLRAQAQAQPRPLPPAHTAMQPQQQPRVAQRPYVDPQPRSYPAPVLAQYPARPELPPARRVLYQAYPNAQRREAAPSAAEHLPMWMRKHQNESPAERERSLRQEPGFSRLPPAQQQNLVNTLHHLDELPPDQRERTLMRMENMERLTPQMRDAVRSSARQLSDLPPERRRLWQKAFRDLRDMPPEQRQEMLRSPQFAGQFSAQERSIMGNLLAVEPYRNPGPTQAPPLYGR